MIDEPSTGMALSEKVKIFIKESDCILVLATQDNKDEATGTYQPRANVSHEIGYAEALSKPIIYLKHKDVNFGTNYSDKVWISFLTNDYHTAYKQIIEETKKLNLLSIVGKIKKESIKSEIIDKTLRLVDILNINDPIIKSNILFELSLAMYMKSEELTSLETKDFFEFYPEYTQTCAYDGYKNENLDGAIRLLSFSLQLNPVSSRKVDYISMLSDALYLGEGMLDEDIKKELNSLLMEEAREGSLFNDERHIKKIIFYLEILNDENRTLFWGHASNTKEISHELVLGLKKFIFSLFSEHSNASLYFEKPMGFPIFLSFEQPTPIDIEEYRFKTKLEEKLEHGQKNEKKLIFRFLSQHINDDDINGCIAIINNGVEDIVIWVLWLIGETRFNMCSKLIVPFKEIFNSKNHKLIGVLATAIGKIGTKKFNDQLIKSLKDFDFESRRRIIWCMGRLKSPEFKDVLADIKVEENNYALKEELDSSLMAFAEK